MGGGGGGGRERQRERERQMSSFQRPTEGMVKGLID